VIQWTVTQNKLRVISKSALIIRRLRIIPIPVPFVDFPLDQKVNNMFIHNVNTGT
jgi:hypothetical protein